MGEQAVGEQGMSRLANPLENAVVWVEKARKGSAQWVVQCPEQQMCLYRWRKRMKRFMHSVMAGYLALAFVEEPSWCLGDAIPCAGDYKDMWESGSPVLPFHVTNSIEIGCLFVLVLRTFLRKWSLRSADASGAWHWLLVALLGVAGLDCVVAVFNTKGIVPGTFRIARLCRPLIFVCGCKPSRLTLMRVLRSIPLFFNVLLSLGVCVALWSWVGVILFSGRDEGRHHFANMQQAFASIWILFTTANNPDVWLDSYNEERLSFFFFASYLVVALYCLNNILLASVYSGYREQLKIRIRSAEKNRHQAIGNAFKLLANDAGVITRDRWAAFYSMYCNPRFGGVSHAYTLAKSNLAFDVLDADCTGKLDFQEFRLIVNVLTDTQTYIPRKAPAQLWAGPKMKAIQDFLRHGTEVRGIFISGDSIVDTVILIDLVLLLVQTKIFIDECQAGGVFSDTIWRRGSPWFWVTFTFSCFYFLEINLKLLALGPARYWNRNVYQHRFDFLNVYALFTMELVGLWIDHPSSTWMRVWTLQHIMRVHRLLWYVTPLRELALMIVRLAPTYSHLGLLLCMVFYMFATVGEQVFGGLIREGNQALDGTSFKASNYWALNFNDFFSAMVTLFVLMVVNNWFVLAEAFLKVTGTTWSVVFFVLFYIVVNLIVLNIFVALIMDCYDAMREDLEQSSQADEGASRSPTWGRQRTPATLPSFSGGLDRESVLRRVLSQDELVDSPEQAIEAARIRLVQYANRESGSLAIEG